MDIYSNSEVEVAYSHGSGIDTAAYFHEFKSFFDIIVEGLLSSLAVSRETYKRGVSSMSPFFTEEIELDLNLP